MKIIGTAADSKFLAEVSADEVAQICGFHSHYSDEWLKFNRQERNPRPGVSYSIANLHAWNRRFVENEEKAKQAAGLLHSLADMITNGLPSIVVPPHADTLPPPRED